MRSNDKIYFTAIFLVLMAVCGSTLLSIWKSKEMIDLTWLTVFWPMIAVAGAFLLVTLLVFIVTRLDRFFEKKGRFES